MSATRITPHAATAPSTRRCANCQCPLSRYNQEDFCAGCGRGNGLLPLARPTVPTEVWHSPNIQHALVQREFGLMCRLIRQEAGLRQEDLAEATGLSQAFLSMLESGARKLTSIDKIIQLLDGLQAPLELTGPMLRADQGSLARQVLLTSPGTAKSRQS